MNYDISDVLRWSENHLYNKAVAAQNEERYNHFSGLMRQVEKLRGENPEKIKKQLFGESVEDILATLLQKTPFTSTEQMFRECEGDKKVDIWLKAGIDLEDEIPSLLCGCANEHRVKNAMEGDTDALKWVINYQIDNPSVYWGLIMVIRGYLRNRK